MRTHKPNLDQLKNEISMLREQIEYNQRRPLIRLNKEVVLTLYVILDLAFKFAIIYKVL